MVDGLAFTPYSALAGGVLIGLAAAMFVLLGGRVAGISGIVGGLLRPRRGDIAWRIAFIAGLLVSPWLYRSVEPWPEITVDASLPVLAVAGLFVGIGTRYGAGCTSGHGVCGMARLSPRSLVATVTFIALGFLTTYLLRHLLGVVLPSIAG